MASYCARRCRVCLTALLVFSLLAAAARADGSRPPGCSPLDGMDVTWKDLGVTFCRDAKDEHLVWREVQVKGRTVLRDAESYVPHGAFHTVRKDFPIKGAQTLILAYATGGSAGCLTIDLYTSHAGGSQFVSANTCYTTVDAVLAQLEPGIAVQDGTFDCFSEADMPSPCVASPVLRRLVYWSDTGWSIDKPGQFPAFYAKQLEKSREYFRRQPDISHGPAALEDAYAALMRGLPRKTALGYLLRCADPGIRRKAHGILSQVEKAIPAFNPITVNVSFPK